MDRPPVATRPVVYPESDGKPMAETDTHRDEMVVYVIEVLQDHFAARDDAYVSGNNFIYWAEGKPKRCVSPDGYVVFGVKKALRPIFKVWEEGARPAFVIEVTSKRTRAQDLGRKMHIYRDELAVPEYFLFDPLGDWLPERLRGYSLSRAGEYVLIPTDPATGHRRSAALGLDLATRDGHVRFLAPGASDPLPTRIERAAEAERRAAEAADEIRRLRAEIDGMGPRGPQTGT